MARFEDKVEIRGIMETISRLERGDYVSTEVPTAPQAAEVLQEMKMRQIRGGYVIPVDNEENELLEKIMEEGTMHRRKLNERERELARKMTSRGLLIRLVDDGELSYRANGLEDVWRE